jgi:hypothetical protein
MRSLLIALTTLLLVSCGGNGNSKDDQFLPDANGRHGEILLLLDDNLWNSRVGEILESNLNKHPEGPYLRPEPMFNYFRKKPDDLNHMNKLNRNILKVMVDHDSTYATTAVLERPNYYAKNQLFVIIKDSDVNRLYEFLLNDFDVIADLFNDFELKQYMRYYKEEINDNVNEMAQKRFGISITIPSESTLEKEKDGFAWVKRERSQNLIGNQANKTEGGTFWIQQGILFWSQKYDSTSQFTFDGVLQSRDTVLKYNVPGKVKGSYMATEYDPGYKPEGREFDFKGYPTYEVRGLWKHAGHRGAFGGGPFVQYTIHNKAKKELITVCGYVYAPKFDKREYIREIDAMLQSIEVIK